VEGEPVPPPTPTGGPLLGPQICRTILQKKVYLIEEQSAVTLPKMTLRDEVVAREKRTALEVVYHEEKQCVTALELKPREVEEQVVCTEMKPITTPDPITGQPCTKYEAVPVTRTVKLTVYDKVPVTREVIVRVPCLKPVEKDVIVTRLVVDCTTIPAVRTQLRAELIENLIRVPSCPPCLPPAPPAVKEGEKPIQEGEKPK
jgi:hypothetical protein